MRNYKKILIVFATILILFSFAETLQSSHSAPNAFVGACKSMGAGMKNRDHPKSPWMIEPDAPNRKWTVEELFRKPMNFSNYYGEGAGTWFYADKVDRGLERSWLEDYWNEEGVQARLESARTFSCVFGRGNIMPQMILKTSTAISDLIGLLVNTMIGEDFMVQGLLDLIGGDGNNEGLISAFFNSIYMPLVIIAFILTAATIIYKGLIQMKMREALSSIIWSTLAFVIGVTLMFAPRFLAEIPQKATSTITTCVLGALNGQNCLSQDVTTSELLTGIECLSDANTDNANSASLMVNGMKCTIWKTFVLEPWAEEQFGIPYNQLYTKNAPSGGGIWVNLPDGAEDRYCVNLKSSKSATEMAKTEVIVDGGADSTVCNVALYQLYLQTEMHDKTNHASDTYQQVTVEKTTFDPRWYDIIVPMAKDESNWRYWAGPGRFMGRSASAAMGLFATFLAAIVLVTLGVFGAVYKITGVLMMAFAPLFLLFAVEPTRGRRIFLGWLESLISSILKYFAITLLLVVSLMLYAGILNNTSGPQSFIAVIVLTVALMMYRKEIVDLIGATNMGGQRLSNKVAKMADSTGKQIKEKGSAYVGGRIGGRAGAKAGREAEIKARKETILDLQKNLNAATTQEQKDEYQKQIDAQRKSLHEIGATDKGKLKTITDFVVGTEDETRMEQAIKGAQRGLKKGKILREGQSAGGKDSLDRSLRRGTSTAAAAFRQKAATKRIAQEDLDKRLEKENLENKKNIDFVKEQDKKRNEKAKFTIEDQRDKVEYVGRLSDEDKGVLNDFAKQITKLDDSELVNEANLAIDSGDKNKIALAENEINARIKFNSILERNSGVLSLHPLANQDYVSEEEKFINESFGNDLDENMNLHAGSKNVATPDSLIAEKERLIKEGKIQLPDKTKSDSKGGPVNPEDAAAQRTERDYTGPNDINEPKEQTKGPQGKGSGNNGSKEQIKGPQGRGSGNDEPGEQDKGPQGRNSGSNGPEKDTQDDVNSYKPKKRRSVQGKENDEVINKQAENVGRKMDKIDEDNDFNDWDPPELD